MPTTFSIRIGATIVVLLFSNVLFAQHRWTPIGGETFGATAFNGQYYWLGSEDGKLLRSDDGLHWSVIPHLLSHIYSLSGIGTEGVIASGYEGLVELSNDGGKTWRLLPTGTRNGLLSIMSCSTDTVVACGTEGTIVRSTDGGDSWDVVNSGDDSLLLCLAFANRHLGYCSTSDGFVLKTEDGGLTWATLRPPGAHQVTTVATIGDSIVLVADNYGYFFHSSDAGSTWDSIRPNYFIQTQKIYYTDGRVFAVGADPTNRLWYHSEDSGKSWNYTQDTTIDNEDVFMSMTMNSGNLNNGVGIRAGFPGLIERTTDGGVSWLTTAQSVMHCEPFETASFNGATFTDSLNGFVYGDGNRMMKTTDGGITWITQILFYDSSNLYTRSSLCDALFFSKDSGIVVGYDGWQSYFTTTNAGLTWVPNHSFDNYNDLRGLYYICAVGSNRSLLCGDSTILSSSDHGESWQNDTTFTGGWHPGKIVFLSPDSGYLIASWANFPIQIVSILWTTDAGLTWQEIFHDTIPWMASILQFRSPLEGYMHNLNGQLLHTIDGCKSWDTIQLGFDSLIYDLLMLSDSVGFAVGQNRVIFSTTNGWKTSVRDTIPFMSSDASNLTLFHIARFGNSIYAVGQENIYKLDLNPNPLAAVHELANTSESNFNITVNPNPASTFVNVDVVAFSGIGRLQTLTVMDILGREVMHSIIPADSPLKLDVSSLPSGLYFVTDGNWRVKFAKE